MSFSDDINHPYYHQYQWFLGKIEREDDRASKALKALCRDIYEYDMLHSELLEHVKEYANGREE